VGIFTPGFELFFFSIKGFISFAELEKFHMLPTGYVFIFSKNVSNQHLMCGIFYHCQEFKSGLTACIHIFSLTSWCAFPTGEWNKLVVNFPQGTLYNCYSPITLFHVYDTTMILHPLSSYTVIIVISLGSFKSDVLHILRPEAALM